MMSKSLFAKLALFVLLVQSFVASALAEITNVDIRDLRDFSGQAQLVSALTNCQDCWPSGVTFHPYGTDRNKDFTHDNAVYWTVIDSKSNGQYLLASLIRHNSKMYVREHLLKVSGRTVFVSDINDIDVNEGSWNILVKGLQRELILSHSASRFKIVIPLVIGGFDITETQLKLPPSVTHVSKVDSTGNSTNWYSRTEPAYYQGYPFIKLLNSKGVYTAYGIHAPMNPGAMKRGFWSTGCIRIRIMDLYPIYYLVQSLGSKKTTVKSVKGSLLEQAIHPYPLMDDKYKRVNKKKPIGEDGLSNMEVVEMTPPLNRLN